eukprot:TRINITY_DN2082_c0_g1::TRINITY_DN2082_c0_g1_i1::g.21810::m.21810 TRINITY_DN2082_c0_g1::TRINITY_DN2082_c0_g1_i1::g.21810  ORF type:complete len:629 (+),score=166.82,sp/P09960/LKHA4_HUMAN/46.00/0.0,Peptidase_M1/PF01433.15/3e-81,Leuk-A4-hydro_C/PF09127.6/6.4e-38,Peptidase_MA_2/PF13485.1/5.6e-16,Peptidase_M61/PF05299.7/0.29,DUF1570/PF07607.6/0.085,Peptidase_M48/PF01435.13/0.19 TRINITY_DN2082_c0_g1_i1:55-1887(+)
MDPCSLANINAFKTEKVVMNVYADFSRNVLTGSAILSLRALENSDHVVLDTRDLSIQQVQLEAGSTLEFQLGKVHPAFGTPLTIKLPQAAAKDSVTVLTISYETSPNSSAIQWLSPEQTAGKKHPYLFTQCQAIHARSLIPCQDSPAIKAPYEANITVDAAFTAVMSAVLESTEPKEGNKKVFKFVQAVPIPSYLIALAVGDLVCREIGPRSRVWSEEPYIEAAAWEFAETESYLAAGEELFGDYVWGRYDLLLLPPSFPYGGMENPCLTFVTPTLLAGDRSLVTVVAHEIAHSWAGNLVTNANWEHFWLNEGFTMYLERSIVSKVHGADRFEFQANLGLFSLKESVNSYGADHPFTALVPKLQDVDPDDSFSSIPYEKGFNFLYYLCTLAGGRDVFTPFLKTYFNEFKYRSITSDDFKGYYLNHFSKSVPKEKLDQIDWAAWYSTPGMPIVANEFDQSLCVAAEQLASSWRAANSGNGSTDTHSANDIANWPSNQVVLMLEKLIDGENSLSHDVLAKMDACYGFSQVKNAEIRFRWLQLALKADYPAVVENLKDFITSQGRMKFVRPLYKSWYKSKLGGKAAQDTFLAHRNAYHNIAAKMIAKDIEVTL